MRIAALTRALSFALSATDFVRDIQPILQRRCYGCHGPQVQMGKLRLDIPASAIAANRRIVELTAAKKMPPTGALPAAEIAILQSWSERPWSFQPLHAQPNATIDQLIRNELSKHKIQPSPEADKRTLVRRIYLDLTGLPPTPAELQAFLRNPAKDAYEQLVDQLLRSPHYGEKWARHWLDLARYADSEGGVQDYGRPAAWRYRDWVIQALNADMPFDQFTIEQLAGDLLPNATLDQKIAAGFHRHTITSREGGVELDRIRFEQLLDRTATTATVWLGLTAGCAQCHDHKYDPITQRDFYSLMAFFENTDEVDLDAPLAGEWGIYRQYEKEFRTKRDQLLAEYQIAGTLSYWENGVRHAMLNPGLRPNWDVSYDSFTKLTDHGRRTLFKSPALRSRREQDSIVDYFVKSSSGAIGKETYDALKLKELAEKLKKLDEKYPRLSTVMTLAETGEDRPTHVRVRGNWADFGAQVQPATIGSLPRPAGPARTRLDLAKWLVSRENPLTARVTVNRIWQELFGRGLVRTAEDFGAQGEKPTHPELLDFLATDFQKNGWSVKRTIRQIVTSATYRQSSNARPDLQSIDPLNTLLARQSRIRLPAELIRDSALHASGLLNDAVGGESIRPPQPDGVADLQYSMKWEETRDRARYRRGLYIFLQRTAAYPLLMNFDVPDRTVSCARRETSNTPLQPLNLMNDPVFVEAAQALAARIESEPEPSRLDTAFQLALSRPPTPSERDAVQTHLAKRGWFGVARALLNTDEFLTRE